MEDLFTFIKALIFPEKEAEQAPAESSTASALNEQNVPLSQKEIAAQLLQEATAEIQTLLQGEITRDSGVDDDVYAASLLHRVQTENNTHSR